MAPPPPEGKELYLFEDLVEDFRLFEAEQAARSSTGTALGIVVVVIVVAQQHILVT